MKNLYNDLIQQYAIQFGTGPACVLAGPGSGKTFIITNRIQNLISKGVPPSQILVITFTKAAAMEMKTRFIKLSGNNFSNVTFGTFHSIYLNILKQFNPSLYFRIIDVYRQKELLSKIIKESKIFTNNSFFSLDYLDDLLNSISFFKSCKKIPAEYNRDLFLSLYNEYEECKHAAGYIDYDDILILTLKLLNDRTDVRDYLNKKYNYILVDEFQDINQIQYDILKLIINSNNNIFVVGDDDQSIYGFRGAKPGIMEEFMNDFPSATKIELVTNYRSTKPIIDAANTVIKHNLFRLKTKDTVVASDNPGKFNINLFDSAEEEMIFIKKMILEHGKENVCVLTRTNKDARIILGFLNKNIYSEQFSVKDETIENEIHTIIRAYISFCINNDRAGIIKIIKYPNRYISKDIFTDETVDLNRLALQYGGTYKGTQLDKLNRIITILKKSSPFAFITYLINYAGLKESFIKEFGIDRKDIIDSIFMNCINLSKESHSLSNLYDKLQIHIQRTDTNNNFNVMTYHASKGLEFEIVILPGVNEGKIPGRSSLATDNVDEERRLFYVAMTRAKRELYITAIKKEGSLRMLPSRFITEFI